MSGTELSVEEEGCLLPEGPPDTLPQPSFSPTRELGSIKQKEDKIQEACRGQEHSEGRRGPGVGVA